MTLLAGKVVAIGIVWTLNQRIRSTRVTEMEQMRKINVECDF